jgi:hypothetical protein
MGYSTNFTGQLGFNRELTGPQLARLNEIFGEDCRDHPEWGAKDLYYIDLELTPKFDGVKWNGAEKTYGMHEAVNLVTRLMRASWPEFSFTGSMAAQGEDPEDRWQLYVNDEGIAEKRMVLIVGTRCACPECGHNFIIEDCG